MTDSPEVCDAATVPSGSPIPWNRLQLESGPWRSTHVFWLSLAWLAVLPSQVQAQEAPDG